MTKLILVIVAIVCALLALYYWVRGFLEITGGDIEYPDEEKECPYSLCNGSGYYEEQTSPEDIQVVKCPCNEPLDMDDNS